MAQRDVCPENLRFTQDSIKNTFKRPYEHQRIDDAVVQIGNNQLSPAVLMPLNVVQHKSVLWCLNNRRLWVLRKAGVPTANVVFVAPNFNRGSEDFFSSLSDPRLERRYSSANYFPRVRGGVRSVTINRGKYGRSGRVPRPPIRLPLYYPTAVAGAAQANRTPPRHLRGITVRSNIPALPTALHHSSNYNIPTISNNNSGPHENQDSDSLWGKTLNVANSVIYKGFGFFGFIPPRSFNLSNGKVVTLGKLAFIVLVFCFVLRQAYNLDKGGVNSNLKSRETITVIEDGKKVFRVRNGGGSCEIAVNDQNSNNMRMSGYLRIVAVKAVVGMEKMISHLLSKMFCFLRYVVWNAVDLSKGVVVSSGRKTLDTCGVILSQCFSRLQFITGQVAVRLGRMGIRVSVFCLEKIWELLRFIGCQALRLAGEMAAWPLGKMKDALSFCLEKFLDPLRFILSFRTR